MSHNFNGYNAPSQNSHASTGQTFEGLSGSLIVPDPSTPVQQNFSQGWPGPQGWQNHGQNHFNFGLTFPPPPPIDAGPYFTNNQEDFVPFDKTPNFYENENVVTDISASLKAPPPVTQTGEVEESDREQMKSRLQDLMSHPAMKRPSSEVQGQPQAQYTANQSSAPKPDANARAAELRAKLLANRGSTPVASTGVASKLTDVPKGKSNDAIVLLKPSDISQAASLVARKTNDKITKAPPQSNSSDNPPTNPATLSLDKANAITDIDGLFAETRAAMAAESINLQRQPSKVENAGSRVAEKANIKSTVTPVEKPSEASASESRRRSFNNSTPSSEMSELGEIRSDSGKPSRTSNPSEATKMQERKENGEEAEEGRGNDANIDENFHRLTKNDNISKTANKAHGQGIEAGVMTSPKAPRNGSSNKSDMSTPQHLSQTLKIENRQDRNGHPASTQESRRDNEQARRPGPNLQDSGNRSRPVLGYQQWVPHDRDRTNYQRDGEARRPQPPRYDVNENARAAAEYKRELEARRQQAAAHKAEIAKDHNRDKVEPTKDYGKKEREIGQQSISKKVTSEAQQPTTNSRPSSQSVKLVDDIKATGREGRVNETIMQLSEQDYEKIEDARDWLEMTGYFDVQYRKKGLTRFRKLRAIDIEKAELERERAELEREAQLDFEGRSHFARSQSAFPGESVERSASGSLLSPQVIRSSITAMPPPPLPIKDFTDDMGIKIKDSANRENFSSRRASDDAMRSGPKHYEAVKTSAHTLKRHHEPDEDDAELDGARPADKLARTDFKGRMDENNFIRSPVRGRDETWGPDNNNARYNGDSRANERRGRNKSADSRNRSGSPIRGRTFGYDQYIPGQHSRGSPNGRDAHSPNRSGISRHTMSHERPKDVNRLWCQNCDQPDHSVKECPEPVEQQDQVARETRFNVALQSRAYPNKKFDVKREEERDFQPSEDEHQTSRSSAGYYHYHHPNNYRGRGRGRGGYTSANGRGGYRPSRGNEGNQDAQNGSGSASLNLEEGG